MSYRPPPQHTIISLPNLDPMTGGGARLVWLPSERDDKFQIHGLEDYEPAVFSNSDDLVRFCLATLAVVTVRHDDQLRAVVADVVKGLIGGASS